MSDAQTRDGGSLEQFLAYVREEREAREEEIRREAEARARSIVSEARQAASSTVRTAAAEARRSAKGRLEAVRAELATRARQREQELALVLLARAWAELRRELRARWEDPESRARWEARLMERASTLLPGGERTVHHPEGFVPTGANADARYEIDPTIEAGLRVTSGSACLDGTLEGLLSERTRVEGRLLSALLHGVEEP